MKEPNLTDRVMGALRLEPMSPSELAMVLSTTEREALRALHQLRAHGLVQVLSSSKAWIRTPHQRRAA